MHEAQADGVAVKKLARLKSDHEDEIVKNLAKWLDSLTIVVGVAITALACVNGSVQQCVSTFAAVQNVINQESYYAVPTVPGP